MSDLLNVDKVLQQVLDDVTRLPAESIALSDCLDRVLAGDVRAEISLPPFANSSMDGYAVRSADAASASPSHPVRLRVIADIPAGSMPAVSINPGEAARIFTGAPLPDGADAVVPVEDTDTQFIPGDDAPLPESVGILKGVGAGSYVRPVGEDIQAGEVILTDGTLLRPQEIGVLAALGLGRVEVIKQPRVAILSTGDELVTVDEPLAPGKIRDVNRYTLAGLVHTYGGEALHIPTARDTLTDVRQRFHEALALQPDIIISSAGVSVGSFDVVRAVLAELGQVDFWRVNLRPGKPLAYGHLQGLPFFGLPGNPVSAMVTFDVFVRPVLLKLGGRPNDWQTIRAQVGSDLTSDGRRSYLRVRLERAEGRVIAHPTGTQSSGALTSMIKADGLLIIPEDVTHVAAGTTLEVRLLKPIM